MKSLILTAILATTSIIATPVNATQCGTLNNGTQACVNDGGTNADFMFVSGPKGGEFIRVICDGTGGVTYWESNGKNTQEYVVSVTDSWCGG